LSLHDCGPKHRAGIHQVIDPEAVKILKRYRGKVVVVNGFKPENVLTAIRGKHVGRLIDWAKSFIASDRFKYHC
jgi:uridylate kinase